MKYLTYIFYSEKLDRYYVGSTVFVIEERLSRHISDFYGKSKYTHKAKDWKVDFTITF